MIVSKDTAKLVQTVLVGSANGPYCTIPNCPLSHSTLYSIVGGQHTMDLSDDNNFANLLIAIATALQGQQNEQ